MNLEARPEDSHVPDVAGKKAIVAGASRGQPGPAGASGAVSPKR
jgi:hypothetical protein